MGALNPRSRLKGRRPRVLRGHRTENGLIELCRRWQGEPFYKVRWPHGRRSQHNAKELVPASRSWR
jgi:hypothetical protein